MIELIAAMTKNGFIGDDKSLPWKKMKNDMRFFRKTTTGKAIIMGRTTFESLGSKPLPKRLNIVLSSTLEETEGIEIAESLEEAIEIAHKHDMVPIIIGGGKVYAEAIKIVDIMYLTVVHTIKEGKTYFPAVELQIWDRNALEYGEADEDNEYSYTIWKVTKNQFNT